MAISGLPLKMFGMPVGTARINDDGTVDLIMDSPCQFGLDLLAEFEAGQHEALVLTPAGVPTTPQPAPEE